MTDQEVMAYMHRFLDDDLSEEEAELLLEHLKQSPASEAMFNRLVQLNDDLQQLPKVTPPISIVDAIIPQLEREGLWEEPIAAAGGQEQRENWAGMDEPGSRVIRTRTRDMIKWIGGVAAAGIALTVFVTTIFNGSNTNHSANDSALMSANMATSSSSAEVRESAGMAVMDQYGGDVESGAMADQSMDMGDQAMGPADADSTAIDEEDTFSFDSSAIGLDGLKQDAAVDKPRSSGQRSVTVTSKSSSEAPASSSPNAKAAGDTAAGAGADAVTGGGPDAGAGVSGSTGDAAEPKSEEEMELDSQSVMEVPIAVEDQMGVQLPPEGGSQPDSDAADNSDADIFVIEETNPHAYVSVDKASIATATAAAGGTQVIVTDREGHVKYRSGIYDGEMTSLVWFADSKQLMLELSVDGSVKQVRIDIVNQTDTLLSE